MEKSECRWIASRWQLADCLTKPNLGKHLRDILTNGATRLHEVSLAQLKRTKAQDKDGSRTLDAKSGNKTYYVHYTTWNQNRELCNQLGSVGNDVLTETKATQEFPKHEIVSWSGQANSSRSYAGLGGIQGLHTTHTTFSLCIHMTLS